MKITRTADGSHRTKVPEYGARPFSPFVLMEYVSEGIKGVVIGEKLGAF